MTVGWEGGGAGERGKEREREGREREREGVDGLEEVEFARWS